MSDYGTRQLEGELRDFYEDLPHLQAHLDEHYEENREYPLLIDEADEEYAEGMTNVIYHLGNGTFAHVYDVRGRGTLYKCIEPQLNAEHKQIMHDARQRLLALSGKRPAPPQGDEEFRDHISELIDEVLTTGFEMSIADKLPTSIGKINVSEREYEVVRYHMLRDIAGLGPLEPVMSDPTNEDIHVIGHDQCYVDNGEFGMLETNVTWGDPDNFENWLRNMGERIDTPVSDSNPIIDNTLPDGSRINIIYSDDVSIKGPSLTIRQGEEVPLSILQITAWGTLSPRLAAYLWICLENEQTVFVVGETASGKTTTLNAITSFIPRDAKIYTAEDTAEVIPPHNNWQQLLTREGSGEDGADVDMFDLVAAALRSRPDYIIVGEVRGAEGQMAFQAAQTGHPVMLTFHASDIKSMIQRFTGNPINIPETFMDNADVALFQNRVKQGDDVLRRVTSVHEIQGYSKEDDGVITREVFEWDSVEDSIDFTGQNNSYVLEEQIAPLLGLSDPMEIYEMLDRRTEVINRLIDNGVLGYDEANQAIRTFQVDGVEALDIDTTGLI